LCKVDINLIFELLEYILPIAVFELYSILNTGLKEKYMSVIVFSTPTCSWCRKLKSFLKQNQVRFKDIDVSKDAAAMRDMVRKSGQRGVPQMWINNKPIVGFDEKKITKELKNA